MTKAELIKALEGVPDDAVVEAYGYRTDKRGDDVEILLFDELFRVDSEPEKAMFVIIQPALT